MDQALQRTGMNRAIFAGSLSFALNQSAIPENPDVLRHHRLAAPELLIKLVQVFGTFLQHLQNSDPYRVGNGSEQL
jgi:hypothetical protein